MKTPKAILKQRALVTEAHVQQTVVEFLELDGWRAIRTDPVSRREWGKGFGEAGMPDYLFLRYYLPDHLHSDNRPIGEVLWIEFKRPGQKPRADQIAWHEAEHARGALVLVVDDIDHFIAWYKTSGLQQH